MKILLYLTFLSDFSVLIPLITAYINRKSLNGEIRILFFYVVLLFLRNFISLLYNFIYQFKGIYYNNVIYYNWYCIIGFYTFTFLYFKIIKNQIWRQIIIAFWVIFLFFIYLDIQNQTLLDFNTAHFSKYTFPVSGVMILFIVLAYLYQLLQDLNIENITKFSYFWLSSGALFYFGGTILMYVYVATANKEMGMISWTLDIILVTLFNIAIAIAFYHKKTQKFEKLK